MPFKSTAQLGKCYRSKDESWNCKKWVKETDCICCLPNRVGGYRKRYMHSTEKVIGKTQTGPRGGKFFIIKEKDHKTNKMCHTKVYIPK